MLSAKHQMWVLVPRFHSVEGCKNFKPAYYRLIDRFDEMEPEPGTMRNKMIANDAAIRINRNSSAFVTVTDVQTAVAPARVRMCTNQNAGVVRDPQ
jgi:hypothetical protein